MVWSYPSHFPSSDISHLKKTRGREVVSLLTNFSFALLAGKLCSTLAFGSGAPWSRWVHCGSLLYFCIHRLGAEGSQASEPWEDEDLLTLQHV